MQKEALAFPACSPSNTPSDLTSFSMSQLRRRTSSPQPRHLLLPRALARAPA